MVSRDNPQVSEGELEQEILVKVSTAEAILITAICMMTPMEGEPGISPEYEILHGVPVLVEGVPGIGKTARGKQMASAMIWQSAFLFVGQHPPEDFSGALIPDGKGGVKQICPLAAVREMTSSGKDGFIALDEINQAPPATQGAAQVLIHERIAGDQPVPGNIRYMAMCNPEKMAAGGYRIAPSLANRFVHIFDLGPTYKEYRIWRMGGYSGVNHQNMKAWKTRLYRDWRKVSNNTAAKFTGYARHAGLEDKYITDMPELSHPSASRAWQSARTFNYAERLCTTAIIVGASESIQEKLIEAAIGKAHATALFEYFVKHDLPDPEDVLSGKWKVKDANGRLDIVMAAYHSMISYVVGEKDGKTKQDMGANAYERLNDLFDTELADLVVDCVDNLKHRGLGRRDNMGHKKLEKAARTVLIKLKGSGVDKYLDDLT
jgi:hypothetical protein